MKTLVGIQGHSSVQRVICGQAQFYRQSKCDIVGIDWKHDNVECWPADFVGVEAFGTNHRINSASLPTRLVDVVEWMLSFKDYEAIWLTEYDTIFLNPVPEITQDGIGTFLAGFSPPHWQCGAWPFLHPPFWMNRKSATEFVRVGRKLLAEDKWGNGTPDVFAGMICSAGELPIWQPNVWSCNSDDLRCVSKLYQARSAASGGAIQIHGVKRRDHIDFILAIRGEIPPDSIWE